MNTRFQRLVLRQHPHFFINARRWYGAHTTIFYDEGLEEDVVEGTAVVSKKASKKATVRNKIKRQIISVLRMYVNTHQDIRDLRMVIVVKPNITKVSFIELQKDIEKGLGQATVKRLKE